MDFDLSEEQRLLVDTVLSFVKKQSPVSRMRALREDPVGWSRDVWRQMGELGWLSVPFPESVGGFGGSSVDVAVVLEKLGTTLVPEPYVPSVVLAGTAILRAGDDAQKCALAAAARADDGDTLAAPDLEVDAVEDGLCVKPLGDGADLEHSRRRPARRGSAARARRARDR